VSKLIIPEGFRPKKEDLRTDDQKEIDRLKQEIETLIDKDHTYKCYEKEIKELKADISGLERIVDLMTSSESNSISSHNAKVLWESYLKYKRSKK